MKIKIEDFFSLLNSVSRISDEDYEKVDPIIDTIKAFERSAYQGVYIIDYYKKGFLYVSKNIAKLCGCNPDEIMESGYLFYLNYVPEDDLKMLVEINNRGFKYFENLPISEKKDYFITYDFHIVRKNRRILINHKLTPLVLSKDGRIWLAICTISLASGQKSGNVIIKKPGADKYLQYSFINHDWICCDEIELTEIERDILFLSAQGYKMSSIADHICRSVDTVKAHKRNIFQKMEVNNITEAITYAQNHLLI